MTSRILISALLVSILPFAEAFARLDYIDANGVTETGGTPAQARMLPRTGADGKLDASLLPPLGSLASIPDPKRLYVSASAPAGGNGSALAPFQTLQEAVTNVQAGGAVLVAPGAYDASWTLPAGSAVTLVGCGPSTVFTDLNVRSTGSPGAAELRIVSAEVTRTALSGSDAVLRLCGARVGTVSGVGGRITVIRHDLGSKVGVLPSGATASYDGYDTVPYAQTLKGASATLVLTGTRPTVGAETVAFLSDIHEATSAVYLVIGELRDSDRALATSLSAASNALSAADSAIATDLAAEASRLDARIDNVNKPWETALSTLTRSIARVISDYTNTYQSVTNEVQQRKDADLEVRDDFATADAKLDREIRNDLSDAFDTMTNKTIQAIARVEADGRIYSASNGLITAANNKIRPEITAVDNRVTSLGTRVSQDESAISANIRRISVLKAKVNALIRYMDSIHRTGIGEIPDDW